MFELNALEERARDFAVLVHGDQRYGDAPYVAHLAAVREVLHDVGINGDIAVAAWLHDVVEDTEVGVIDLDFGKHVGDLVWAVTGVGANREARTACAYAKIPHVAGAIRLKLADRIANVEASADGRNPKMLALYKAEYPAFKAALCDAEAGLRAVRALWARLDAALA